MKYLGKESGVLRLLRWFYQGQRRWTNMNIGVEEARRWRSEEEEGRGGRGGRGGSRWSLEDVSELWSASSDDAAGLRGGCANWEITADGRRTTRRRSRNLGIIQMFEF
jgi:hypothetical protein